MFGPDGRQKFAELLLKELGLHFVGLARGGIRPLQVVIRDKDRPFQRFSLGAVFEGDFSGIPVHAPEPIAKIKDVWSAQMQLDGEASGKSTPLSSLLKEATSQVALQWRQGGCKAVQIAIDKNASIIEADADVLESRLQTARVLKGGPLDHAQRKAYVIHEVALAQKVNVRFFDKGESRLKANAISNFADVATGLSAEWSAEGDLCISHPTPVVFGVGLWSVVKDAKGGPVRLVAPDRVIGQMSPRGPIPSTYEILDEGVIDDLGKADEGE